ncbi:hypothetical protein CCAX7_40140 [Capsulimonas corticalis]|uniref:Uncharacterized protein n=1 Tax=Capsulimonas corticalis TaxID=2219043 RepID=A0A402D4V9_9BACT|nr:WD40 repeat domain-containing protein [Capsulimonas corticalis]BDI31963.1 hypothetical protein CCAX7_40140 [Capsulimonas corticalis]
MIVQRWIVSTLAVGFVFGATALWQRSDNPFAHLAIAQGQSPEPKYTFSAVWPQPLPVTDFRSASISPDNAFFAVVASDKNTVTLRHQNGKKIWSIPDPGATKACVSAGGDSVITYAPLNPTRPSVTIVRGIHADSVTRRTLDGAIWDASMSQDGKTAAVVTGNHSLYLFTMRPQLSCNQWSIDGIGNSVAVNTKTQCVVAGTWDDSGVACYNFQGQLLWKYPSDAGKRRTVLNRLFEAQFSQDGQYVLGISYSNIHHSDGVLYLWQRGGNGVPLWSHALGPDASDLKARITADGRYVALSYLQNIAQGDRSAEQRWLLLLDHNGKEVVRRGGLLFPPNLVSVSPDGSIIAVSVGDKALYNVNNQGRVFAPKSMDTSIRQTATSPDGTLMLVYTGDGALSLVRPL